MLNESEKPCTAKVKMHIIPVDEKGKEVRWNFCTAIHNFTEYWAKPHSEVVYLGTKRTVTLNVHRELLIGGRLLIHEYAIFLYNGTHSGGKLVRIEPREYRIELSIRIRVYRVSENSHSPLRKVVPPLLNSSSEPVKGYCYEELEEVVYTSELMPALQLHSIGGISVSVHFEIGNYLFYSQKYREADLPGEWGPWQTSGDKATKSNNKLTTGSISGGSKKWIYVNVDYRYERWFYGVDWVQWWREIVTPVSFGGYDWGESISCTYCEGTPTGFVQSYPRGTGMPIEMSLGPGISEIERSGISVSFEVSYGVVSLTVELWYEIERGEALYPPSILVNVDTWYADTLYVFDASTEWKVVHFTWSGGGSGGMVFRRGVFRVSDYWVRECISWFVRDLDLNRLGDFFIVGLGCGYSPFHKYLEDVVRVEGKARDIEVYTGYYEGVKVSAIATPGGMVHTEPVVILGGC